MAPSSPSPAVAKADAGYEQDPMSAVTMRPRRTNSASAPGKNKNKTRAPRRKKADDDDDECALANEEADTLDGEDDADPVADAGRTRRVAAKAKAKAKGREGGDPEFVGDPVPAEEARATWPKRYERATLAAAGNRNDDDFKARRHYRAAKVEDTVYNLGDHVYAEEGNPHFIGTITELFEGTDHGQYFNCCWFFRPKDTVISTTKLLDLEAKAQLAAGSCDLYYDMSNTVTYSQFGNIASDTNESSGISSDSDSEAELSVTGLSVDGAPPGLKHETRWAFNFNSHACKSSKSNHPQTQVRNEKANDFLSLLKEWDLLCDQSSATKPGQLCQKLYYTRGKPPSVRIQVFKGSPTTTAWMDRSSR